MFLSDLHTHSLYSNDGEFKVDDLILSAAKKKVSVLSLTDHNSTRGVNEALEAATIAGITVIPGIEIDCNYEDIDLHLLGYNINWKSIDFPALETAIHEKIMQSFPAMIKNLAMAGIPVDADEVLAAAKGIPPSAELIAEVLLNNPVYHDNKLLWPYMKGGLRSDMPYINFYLDYFAQGRPAYVKMEFMRYSEAVRLIIDNGGVAVVAHPGMNLKTMEGKIEELLDQGASGLEVFNNYHELDQISYFGEVAMQRKVLATCGSDYHGKTKPLIRLGTYKTIDRFQEYVNQSVKSLV